MLIGAGIIGFLASIFLNKEEVIVPEYILTGVFIVFLSMGILTANYQMIIGNLFMLMALQLPNIKKFITKEETR